MSKYLSSSVMKKIALYSGILALVNGLLGLGIAIIPFLAFLACFVAPFLCIIGLALPGWAGYVGVKDKGYSKDQIADGLITGALAGAVSGAVTGTIGAIFSIINSVVGAGASAAYSSLGGFEDVTGDFALSAGGGILGGIICAPFSIIIAMIIGAVIGAIVALIVVAMTDSGSSAKMASSEPAKADAMEAEKKETTEKSE